MKWLRPQLIAWLLLAVVCGSFWGRNAVSALRWLAKSGEEDRAISAARVERLITDNMMTYRLENSNLLVVVAHTKQSWKLGSDDRSDNPISAVTLANSIESWANFKRFPYVGSGGYPKTHLSAKIAGGQMRFTRTVLFPESVSDQSLDHAERKARDLAVDLGVGVLRQGHSIEVSAVVRDVGDGVQFGVLGPVHKSVQVCWTALDNAGKGFSRDEVSVCDVCDIEARLAMSPVLP